MAQPKIKMSMMSVAKTITATDSIMILQDGVNKTTTVPNLLKNLITNDNIRLNPTQLSINTSIATKNDASALFINGSTDKIGVGTNTPASKFHVIGNVQVGSASADGITVQSTEVITYTSSDNTNGTIKPISPTRTATILQNNVGVFGQYSLSPGFNGQIKTIVVNTLDVGKNVVISLTGEGFNTITLNVIGESAVLQYFTSTNKWYLIGGLNPLLSTI